MTEIKDWDDLEKLPPSKTHYINVARDEKSRSLDTWWISPFNRIADEEHYLSTHVFYGGKTTNEYNELLKKCGFNAKIVVEDE